MKPLWHAWNRASNALRSGRKHRLGQMGKDGRHAGLRSDVARIRDAFRVEALEPRVLLSADPLFSPLKTFFLPEDRAIQEQLAEAARSANGSLTLSSADVLQGLLERVQSQPVDLQASPAVDAYVTLANGTSSATALMLEGDWRVPVVSATEQGGLPIFEGSPSDAVWAVGSAADGTVRAFGAETNDAQRAETLSWALSLPASQPVDPLLAPVRTSSAQWLQSGIHDLAVLSGLDTNTLWLAPDAVLKGSGSFGGNLTVEGVLSPGY